MTHTPPSAPLRAEKGHTMKRTVLRQASAKKAQAGGQGPQVNLSSAGLSGKQPVPAL